MESIEISIKEFRSILVSVFKKAVNSYFDLSDLVADEAIDEFIENKNKEKINKFCINHDTSRILRDTHSLAPSLGSTTIYQSNSGFDAVNFVVPNYADYYNRHSLVSSTGQINVIGTTLSGDSNGL